MTDHREHDHLLGLGAHPMPLVRLADNEIAGAYRAIALAAAYEPAPLDDEKRHGRRVDMRRHLLPRLDAKHDEMTLGPVVKDGQCRTIGPRRAGITRDRDGIE